MRDDLKSITLFSVSGIIVGVLSFVLNSSSAAVGIALLGAVLVKFVADKVQKEQRDLKWYLGNGLVVYIFLWIIVWTILYNLVVI